MSQFDEADTCQRPSCSGASEFVGRLGPTSFYRCRTCGWNSSRTTHETDMRGQRLLYNSMSRAQRRVFNERG